MTDYPYPTVFTTVDVAIIDPDNQRVLLGRKSHDGDGWRFPGGFAEPYLGNFEANAQREVLEETGLTLSSLAYLGSFPIDDARYRDTPHQIVTLFFLGHATSTDARPGDDLDAVGWWNLSAITEQPERIFVANHLVLAKCFIQAVTDGNWV